MREVTSCFLGISGRLLFCVVPNTNWRTLIPIHSGSQNEIPPIAGSFVLAVSFRRGQGIGRDRNRVVRKLQAGIGRGSVWPPRPGARGAAVPPRCWLFIAPSSVCAKPRPWRVATRNRRMFFGRAAAGRNDPAALQSKMRMAGKKAFQRQPQPLNLRRA